MGEHLALIADPMLLPYVDSLFSAGHDDPAWLETPITLIAAGVEPCLLCQGRYPSDGAPNRVAKPSPLGFGLGPALDLLFATAGADLERERGVHLCVVASASMSTDHRLAHQFSRLRGRRRLHSVAIDLGGYLGGALGQDWCAFVDYVVTHPGNQVRDGDLRSLFAWLPSCHEGFKMYVFEGHHPGAPTWLRAPPTPFAGRDCAAARKASLIEQE